MVALVNSNITYGATNKSNVSVILHQPFLIYALLLNYTFYFVYSLHFTLYYTLHKFIRLLKYILTLFLLPIWMEWLL